MAQGTGENKELQSKLIPTKTETKPETIEDLIKKREAVFAAALPSADEGKRLVQLTLVYLNQYPDLKRCDPRSIIGGVWKSIQLGLELGTECHLVPFNIGGIMKATFITDYKGEVQLAFRSGGIKDIIANPVFEGDYFDFQYGTNSQLIHRPLLDPKKRGKIVCYYSYAHTTTGGCPFKVMSVEEIEKIRDRWAPSKDSGFSPWKNNPEEMSCKTVFKRLKKYLPLSSIDRRVEQADEKIFEEKLSAGAVVFEEIIPGETFALSAPKEEPKAQNIPATEVFPEK